MDLQKLRPTYSQWRAPLAPVGEGHQRVHVAPKPQAAKPPLQPPKGKGGELWNHFYQTALLSGHPDPEKLADSSLRSRERAHELAAKRPTVKRTLQPPKPVEAAAANTGAAAKKRAVIHEALRCKARTLEGRQCGFKSTCGEFCKKHAVKV